MPWIRISLIERPYYDPRTGVVLSSIEGRRNRPKIDPFTGGGKVYPDLGKVTVLERHEKAAEFLVFVEGDQKEIDRLTASADVTYAASPKVSLTVRAGFKPVALDEAEAEATKETVFNVYPAETESGTTETPR